MTTTEPALRHFLTLRDHPDADPTIQELARVIRQAWDASTPTWLDTHEWHLPYVSDDELAQHGLKVAQKLSAARCASVSYMTVDGKTMTIDRAIAIWDKLVGSAPGHWSPLEHQAKPWLSGGKMCRNFDRWAPLRAFMEDVA